MATGIKAKNVHLHGYNRNHQATAKSHSRQKRLAARPIGTPQGKHSDKVGTCFCGRCYPRHRDALGMNLREMRTGMEAAASIASCLRLFNAMHHK